MKQKLLIVEIVIGILIVGVAIGLKLETEYIKITDEDGKVFWVKEGDFIKTDLGKMEIVEINNNEVIVRWKNGEEESYTYNESHSIWLHSSNSKTDTYLNSAFPVETLVFEK